MIGEFVKSKAGHDKDSIYIVINEDADNVYVVDGRLKTIDKPKKKNKKHIQVIKNTKPNNISTNDEIKREIKLYMER